MWENEKFHSMKKLHLIRQMLVICVQIANFLIKCSHYVTLLFLIWFLSLISPVFLTFVPWILMIWINATLSPTDWIANFEQSVDQKCLTTLL